MLIYRQIARFLLFSIFRFTNITPNQITLISLGVAVIASSFFLFSRYPYIIVGALLLHLTYAFDMLDGIYARYKGLSSKFGRWLDPFTDTVKVGFIFSSLSLGAYRAGASPMVLAWGIVAMIHSFLTYYILNTREHIIKVPTFQIKINKNIYIGYEISLYWIVSLFVLFNRVYSGLIFLATAGALSWIRLLVSLWRHYFKNRNEIEGGK